MRGSDHMQEEVYVQKIIIVGDPAVGKTSLLLRYVEDRFEEEYLSTIGVDFYMQTLNIDKNEVKLQIWDTGGQEKFANIRPGYYTGAAGAVIVFDATNPSSFQNLEKWMAEVRKYRPNIPIVIAQNKVDLPRSISQDDVKAFIETYNLSVFETSAKDNVNIDSMFRYFSRMLLGLKVEPTKPDLFNTLTIDEIKGNYERCATYSVKCIHDGNYMRALGALEKAFIYSNEIKFQQGIDWVQETLVFITKLISDHAAKQPKGSLEVDGLKPHLEKPKLSTHKPVKTGQKVPPAVFSILDSIRDKLVFGISLQNTISRLKNATESIRQVYKPHPVLLDMEDMITKLYKIQDDFTLIGPDLRNELFSKIYEWKNRLLKD